MAKKLQKPYLTFIIYLQCKIYGNFIVNLAEGIHKTECKCGHLYSHLNMGRITDTDYTYPKIIRKYFKTKTMSENNDLYVQSYILLLADVFNNFWNIYLEIYWLDLTHFLSTSLFKRLAALEKTKVKLL